MLHFDPSVRSTMMFSVSRAYSCTRSAAKSGQKVPSKPSKHTRTFISSLWTPNTKASTERTTHADRGTPKRNRPLVTGTREPAADDADVTAFRLSTYGRSVTQIGADGGGGKREAAA